MQVVSLISVTITNKDVGEVYYKAKTVLHLALVEVSSNRNDYYTTKYYFKVS